MNAELADVRVGADGTVYNSAGAAVRGQISDVKSIINNRIIPDDFNFSVRITSTLTENKFISKQGAISDVANSNYYIIQTPITSGKRYLVTASTVSKSPNAFYAYYDSNDTLIKIGSLSPEFSGSSSPTGIFNELTIAPINATYMVVAGCKVPGCYKANVEEVVSAIKALDDDVKYLQHVNNAFRDITSTFDVANGYINANGGDFIAYEQAESTDYIDINKYPNLYITGSPLYKSNVLWAIYTANNVCIATYKNNTFEYDYHFSRDNIIAQYPTAKFVRFSSVFANNGIRLQIKRNAYANEAAQDAIDFAKPWSSKKWVCVGDSLTEVNSRTTMHYHDYIANATGISIVNMGLSGSGYAKKADTNGAFYQRISDVPLDADVVTIFGSGNDASSGLDIGEPADSGTTTLCGCINTTIDNLIAILPTVSLGIVAPTPWIGNQPSNVNCFMAKYTEALKTICANRSIPFLDLYHCSNLRPWTEEGRTACYSKDDGNGVHPDENGHKLIAPRFKSFLESLLI